MCRTAGYAASWPLVGLVSRYLISHWVGLRKPSEECSRRVLYQLIQAKEQ